MLLPIIPGTLPSGVCFATEQERLVAFAEYMDAQLDAGGTFYNYGASKPSVANQAYPWFRTTDGRWYFFSGVWKSPVNYSTYERRLFVGDTTQLQTYDGGDAGTPSSISGPMWTVDTDFAGRSPMAPGDIPTANPAKTLAVGENYGEGAHEQTLEELHPHTHTPDPDLADGFLGHAVAGAPATFNVGGGGDTITMGQTAVAGGDVDGDSVAMPIIHPVRGIYVIKWTGRAFYIVP